MSSERPVLGIICGGGPAPGLNGVVAAATFYANRLGWQILGFHDGYLHLASGKAEEVRENIIELNPDLVAPIIREGGSLIRTDRFDPTRSPQKVSNTLRMLSEFHIKYLLIIGGNDKITCTHLITQGVDPHEMQVLVVPKTIDNDVQLPSDQSTFGYHSARQFGTSLVKNLMMDAKSAPRWFIVETMGRRTGHIALSIAEASGAHLAIIPEDFGEKKIELSDICDVFEGALLKRLAAGKNYGVCVISEGLIHQMSSTSIQALFQSKFINYNSEGQIILDDAELSRAITKEMNRRLEILGIGVRVTPKKIGYELRSCNPNDFDSVYSQDLGYGAIEGFKDNHSNAIVVWSDGVISFQSFRNLMDPCTGRIFPRKIDITSQQYEIIESYMWNVKRADLKNSELVDKLCKLCKMTSQEFISKYTRVTSFNIPRKVE